jgi:hypothetical protein
MATIHRHVNIFVITSYFTLQQVKDSIEIVFGSQLTRRDDNVINIFLIRIYSTRTITRGDLMLLIQVCHNCRTLGILWYMYK